MCVCSCWDDASHLVRVQESTYESSAGHEMLKRNQESGITRQRGHEEGPSIPSGECVLAKSLMDVVIPRVSSRVWTTVRDDLTEVFRLS